VGTVVEEETVDGRVSGKMMRGIYIIVGTIALVIGAIGLFLPVIPTTPLVILAAACYYRGSKRLHAWILSSRWFGETIKNYQAGRGLTRDTKVRAIFLMWTTIIISAWFFVSNPFVRVAIICVAVGVTVYLVRLPTLERN
jgi:uncharacterized membrane protein YbaN (DUF454 family)